MHTYNKNTPIVVLTGAGISAESGLATFRDNDGLWENHRMEDVATPEAYARDPEMVHRFYNHRRQQLTEVQPNSAHVCLAKYMNNLPNSWLITQNVDDLHQRAGSERLLHMHGSLTLQRCTACDQVGAVAADLRTDSLCETCQSVGSVRPHIVWFGEMPLYMEQIYQLLEQCELFLSIGTSGAVYPAAGFAQIAAAAGAHTVELNLVPSDVSFAFAESHYGKATEIVPAYFKKLVAFTD
ncbi:NAD-dependent deacylase [Marinicella sp. W31]|uniref:NAD-dependent deacylase n=1 Tax=Marinicella sp. W31 TaxID=3023713 RepID=UPI0037584911